MSEEQFGFFHNDSGLRTNLGLRLAVLEEQFGFFPNSSFFHNDSGLRTNLGLRLPVLEEQFGFFPNSSGLSMPRYCSPITMVCKNTLAVSIATHTTRFIYEYLPK